MTLRRARRYHRDVHASRFGAASRILAGALVQFGLALVVAAPAAAATQSFDVGDQSIVQVQTRVSSVTIKTWDRNTVEVAWADGEPFVAFRSARPWTLTSLPIPGTQNMKEYEGPNGPVVASFPPEDFPLPDIGAGLHDIVRVSEVPPAADLPQGATDVPHLTLTIPASTKLLFVKQGRGEFRLSDYHGTTIAFSGGTRLVLNNVSGNAFIQNMYGDVYAVNSNFDRIRVRTNHADQVFEQCHIKQIDAQSLTGNIVYDNSSFDPGLARFESDRGNIALGITGNAQLGSHTQDGKIYSIIGRNAHSVAATGNDQNFIFGGGGTLVNATSTHGNVYAYEGSITERAPRTLSAEWRPVIQALWRRRRQLPRNITFPHAPIKSNERQPRAHPRPHANRVHRVRAEGATAKTSAARRHPA